MRTESEVLVQSQCLVSITAFMTHCHSVVHDNTMSQCVMCDNTASQCVMQYDTLSLCVMQDDMLSQCVMQDDTVYCIEVYSGLHFVTLLSQEHYGNSLL